eukprot:Gb_40639 [translate_table: standard]
MTATTMILWQSPSISNFYHSKVLTYTPLRKPKIKTRVLTCRGSLTPLPSNCTLILSRILATTAAISEVISKPARTLAAKMSADPTPQELVALDGLKSNLVCSAGPLFFAAISTRGPINSPLTVVAAGMAKWLELYSGVLMVRVLLSWFPNIPWDRQPLSAIRDLCDPYLNLFRNILPPVFNALDLSPLLAFLVLGFLTALLNQSMGSV